LLWFRRTVAEEGDNEMFTVAGGSTAAKTAANAAGTTSSRNGTSIGVLNFPSSATLVSE
jgi:hypothetical protein